MTFTNERRSAILSLVRMRGSLRLTEVADQVGVSTVTVRRDVAALEAQGLLERVHGGITVLPHPGPMERSANGHGKRFGLVVPSADYYFPSVIEGARSAAAALGLRLVLGVSEYRPVDERRQVERLVQIGADGILLATTVAPDRNPLLAEWIGRIPIPTVLVERQIDPDVASSVEHVRSDHSAGARKAIRHRADLGHERVLVIAHSGTPTTRWLLHGYRACVDRGVLREWTDPVILGPRKAMPRHTELATVLRRAVDNGIRALLVHSDRLAIAAVEAARELGLHIPDEIAIVAYDDEVASLCDVPLTAVRPPKRDVGRLAVEVLLRRVSATDSLATQRIALLPQLMVRASCGARATVAGAAQADPAA